MPTTQRLLWIVVTLLLGGCGKEIGIQSIEHRSGGQDVDVRLIASTNCAERGETITFTLRIENNLAEPVTFTSQPPFNIILVQADSSAKRVEWSMSDAYPQDIPATLLPDQILTYTWPWTVPADFQDDPTISNYSRGVSVSYGTNIQLTPTFKRDFGRANAFSIGIEYGQVGYQVSPCSSFPR